MSASTLARSVARLRRHADALCLLRQGAPAEADLQPAAGDDVDRGQALGQSHRMAQRGVEHEVADPDLVGASSQGRGGGERFEDLRFGVVRDHEVVRQPHAVEAEGDGGLGSFDHCIEPDPDLGEREPPTDAHAAPVGPKRTASPSSSRRVSYVGSRTDATPSPIG